MLGFSKDATIANLMTEIERITNSSLRGFSLGCCLNGFSADMLFSDIKRSTKTEALGVFIYGLDELSTKGWIVKL